MGLFGFGNKNKVNRAPAQPQQGAEWQAVQQMQYAGDLGRERQAKMRNRVANAMGKVANMVAGGGEVQESEVEKKQRLEGERQRRKLAATMLTGIFYQGPDRGQRMESLISAHDVKINNEQYNSLVDMMAKGQVGRTQGQEVISMIRRPVDQYGVSDVFARLNAVDQRTGNTEKTKHMRRILGNFSDTGFDRYNETNASSVAVFLNRFPDAMSFDVEADRFLRSINNPQNSPQKVASYFEAMTDFKRLMYGKEQEYMDQFKVMEQQAAVRKTELERQKERLVATYSEKQLSKMTVKQRRGRVTKAEILQKGEKRTDARQIELEREREDSEDVSVALPEQGVFGVFDGAGGMGNGGEASRAARSAFLRQNPGQVTNAMQLAQMMETINGEVQKTGGMSTAIVAKVNRTEDGRKYLSYASVGDSRLYILGKNGEIRQMTRDEGERNVVWNILGMDKKDLKNVRQTVGVADTERVCLQYQDVWLNEGDRVIMCSDGITGDNSPDPEKGRPGDLLTDQEVRNLASTRTTEQAAENLLLGAKKIDDRTVQVFDV